MGGHIVARTGRPDEHPVLVPPGLMLAGKEVKPGFSVNQATACS
jgi:hypothetical protein